MVKEELRKFYLNLRKNLDDRAFESRNNGILEQLNNISLDNDHFIHLFLPILKQKEPNTYLIKDQISRLYPKIRFVISKSMQSSSDMYHFIWDNRTILKENSWGIPEPIGGQLVQPSDLDVVFVPLLAFDLQGHRIGYGKGYYDRFLADCRPGTKTIGISLFDPVERIHPLSPGDIPLHTVLTPTKTYRFNKKIANLH